MVGRKWTRRDKVPKMLQRGDLTARPLCLAMAMLLLPPPSSYAWASRDGQEETSGDYRADYRGYYSGIPPTFDRGYGYQPAFARGYNMGQYGRSMPSSSLEIYERSAALGNTASYNIGQPMFNEGYRNRYGGTYGKELSYGMSSPEQWEANKGVDEALQKLKAKLGDSSGKAKGTLLQNVDLADLHASDVTRDIGNWINGWDPGATHRIMDGTMKDITKVMQSGHDKIKKQVVAHGQQAYDKLKPEGIESLLQTRASTASAKLASHKRKTKVDPTSPLAKSKASTGNSKDGLVSVQDVIDTSDMKYDLNLNLAGVAKHNDTSPLREKVEEASQDAHLGNIGERTEKVEGSLRNSQPDNSRDQVEDLYTSISTDEVEKASRDALLENTTERVDEG